MTQCERIIKYINDFGSITTYQAFTDLGITRLASRIHDLSERGYEQGDKMKSVLIYDQDMAVVKQGRDSLQDLLNGNDYSVNHIYALIGFLDWMIYHYAVLGEIK